MPEYRSLTDGCHCGGTTVVYRTRAFTKQHGGACRKIYHRCGQCSSRFFEVEWPALDAAKAVSVQALQPSDWLLDTTASIVAQKQARYDALFEDSYVEHKLYGRSPKWHEIVKEMAGLKQMIEGHVTYFADNQPMPEI